MKMITFAASALLMVSGSDHYGSDWNYPPPNTDKSQTSSVKQSNGIVRTPAPVTVYRPTVRNDDYFQGRWGNR